MISKNWPFVKGFATISDTMETQRIDKIGAQVGQEIELKGCAYNFRSSGKIFFLQLRDGSGRVQVVSSAAELPPEQWAALEKLRIESSVTILGIVKAEPRSPSGFEIQGTAFEAIQIAPEDYPIGKKEHGPDFLLDHRHLWLRSEKQWAIQRVRDRIIMATQEYFHENGFVRFDTPILTPTACEATTELFEMDYFEESKAYLAQSGQLYLEAGIMSLGRAYDFGPVFRAEKSKTRRHLTEFWMMDAEAAFVDHAGNMEIQEQLISFIVSQVVAQYAVELKTLERDIEPLKKIVAPFPRITHRDAVQKLHALGSDIKEDDDLGGDDETTLTKEYETPIFIEKYPAKVKAFYSIGISIF